MSAARALRIGTRGSALALAQARAVARALGGAQIVVVATRGDRAPAGGDKARWVGELEAALVADKIDLAVHSAKDVPGDVAEGLAIAAVPARADPRDALCGAASLDDLPRGARVGTSSLRRAALLRAARDDLAVVALRGNVDTRLARLATGDFAALVLARAGLERLGRAGEAGGMLDPEAFVPAPGQGALALEARAGDAQIHAAAATVADEEATVCLGAERALVRVLGATCRTPVGAHATLGAGALTVDAFVGRPDGSAWVRDRLVAHVDGPGDAEDVGARVAERLLGAGAGEILRDAEAAAA